MTTQTISDYYQTYWTTGGFNPVGHIKPELEAILRRGLSPGLACLDLGCGDGQTLGPWLTANGRRYLGVDISGTAVAAAVASGLSAVQVESTDALPFPDDSFDNVCCIEVFEHLFAPEQTAREILRVLKPGGSLIATVPNVAYWRRRLELLILGIWNPLGTHRSRQEPWNDPHIRFFSPPSLGAMLVKAGYTRVRGGGHAGGLLRDLPWVGPRLTKSAGGPVYRVCQRLWPTLLGYGAHAIATKPPAASP